MAEDTTNKTPVAADSSAIGSSTAELSKSGSSADTGSADGRGPSDGNQNAATEAHARSTAELSAVIVDDDPSIRLLVEAVLVAEGYTVTPFPDGNSACAALEKGSVTPPKVIVLDMMMPGLHGLDVLTRLKLKPQLAKIPVIMLTAESRPQDLMSGYEQGADYYITKPFTRQQLVFGLELVLKQSRKQS